MDSGGSAIHKGRTILQEMTKICTEDEMVKREHLKVLGDLASQGVVEKELH